MQIIGGDHRADDVVTPLHDHARDRLQARGVVEQGILRQEDVVAEIVRLDARQSERYAVGGEIGD